MAEEKNNRFAWWNRIKRWLAGLMLVGFFLLVIVGALALPFVYESQTLWYKVGTDRLLLRIGQIVGLLAAISLMLQILLGSRGKFLEELVGVANIMQWHRTNGLLLPLLAIVHIVLVLVPEGIGHLPIGIKYWPEMVGGALLLVIVSSAMSAYFRQRLNLNYRRWRLVHRIFAYLALLGVAIHVLFVADSFSHGVPRMVFLGVLAVVVLVVFGTKGWLWRKK